jgi:hypothetical protein
MLSIIFIHNSLWIPSANQATSNLGPLRSPKECRKQQSEKKLRRNTGKPRNYYQATTRGKMICSISLNNAIRSEKLATITDTSYVLCYNSEDSGKTCSKFEVIQNLTVVNNSHLTAYLPDYEEYDHTGLSLLVYGMMEVIINTAKNNVMELELCII